MGNPRLVSYHETEISPGNLPRSQECEENAEWGFLLTPSQSQKMSYCSGPNSGSDLESDLGSGILLCFPVKAIETRSNTVQQPPTSLQVPCDVTRSMYHQYSVPDLPTSNPCARAGPVSFAGLTNDARRQSRDSQVYHLHVARRSPSFQAEGPSAGMVSSRPLQEARVEGPAFMVAKACASSGEDDRPAPILSFHTATTFVDRRSLKAAQGSCQHG